MNAVLRPPREIAKARDFERGGGSVLERRILLLAPTGNDARLTAGFLEDAGFVVEVCRTMAEVCERLGKGCGAIVLAEETLGPESMSALLEALEQQPSWSDVPVTIITGGSEAVRHRLRKLATSGLASSIGLLERPFHPETLLSTVEVAWRARQRQYQVRDLLRTQRASEQRLQGILESISDAFVALDRDWHFTYVNRSYMKLVELLYSAPEELLGQSVWERFPGVEDSETGRFYKRAMAEQKPGVIEVFYEPVGRWLEVHAYPSQEMLSLYLRDVTERKQHEVELKELNRKIEAQSNIFDTTLSHIADFAYIFDREGHFLYANKPLLDLWGLTIDEAAGKNFHELNYPPELAEKLQRQIQQVIETKQAVTDETPYTNPEGALGYYEYIFSPVLGKGGQVEVVAGSTRVITERKRTEQALRESEERYRTLMEQASDGIFVYDMEGRHLMANAAGCKMLGCTLEELLQLRIHDTYFPEDRPLAEECMRKLRELKSLRIERRMRRRDGLAVDVDASVTLLPSGYVYASLRDVTERRLEDSARRRLAAIVESCGDAIISKDLHGIITSWNEGAERLFGYVETEMVGQSVTVLIPPERFNEEPAILERIRRGERIDHYETVRRRKDGTLVDVALTVSPIRDASGKVVGASKIARDITERKAGEAALKQAKETAEAANRAKDRFLAVLSHELRTPLTPVMMSVAALEMDPELPHAIRSEMTMIRRNVELETKLIDDLLDLSRIISGKLSLRLEPVDLNEMVREAGAICRSQVLEKNIQIKYDLDKDAGQISADPARFQQVLWNVLKNAVKFTPENGSIRVRTRLGAGGRAEVEVKDSGMGITPELLPRIFDAFEQGDPSITRAFGGLGLGLAISRALVDLHGGKITARSEGKGTGAVFVVSMPVVSGKPVSEAAGLAPVQPPQPRQLRLMVVEDHADTARTLGLLLRRAGFVVTTAGDVASALRLADEQSFDVMISDVGLPDGTGFDLMKQLSKRHAFPGIAMSGYGLEEDISRSLEAGFREHLVKPVRVSQLEQAINRVMARNS